MTSTIVKHSEYDIEQLTFNPLSNPKKKTLQSILLPSYVGGRGPLIQLPSIDLDMYGIPSKCDFYKEDHQRLFLKLPLNQKDPETQEITEKFFKKLDGKLNTAEFQEHVLGGKKRYTYQPIVRQSVGENGDSNPDKHPYIKLKLLTEYPSGAILTTVIEQCDDGARFLKTDTKSLSDFEKYFHLRGKLKCIIAPVKIWIHPTNDNNASYGLTFKLNKVLVKMPLERVLKVSDDEHAIDFLDSDSD